MSINNNSISEIEYLIMNEENIDWESLSEDKTKLNSIIEVRLFRKRINWRKYILSHQDTLSTEILNIGCKHFSDSDYKLLEAFGIADEDFIRAHLDKFSFAGIIQHCNLSADFLLEYKEKWINISNIKRIFSKVEKIDLNSPEMADIRLILETL